MSSVKNYDPFNFFYIDEQHTLNSISQGCQGLYENVHLDASCNKATIHTNDIDNCYKLRLCENRDKAEEFRYIKENNNTSLQKYSDTNNEYSEEIMNTINLSVGIVFLSGIIFKQYFS